jgi:L-glutamine-phosphate cytidylyltransferase
MKMILLAAGKGDRLRPYTDDRPKCLVEIAGRTLLDWQLLAARQNGIDEIVVVKGYMADSIPEEPDIKYYINDRYETTNMVETLWCAEPEFDGEIIISYADILYETVLLHKLMEADHDIDVVVDTDWRAYWERRFSDPVLDAESLKMNADGTISNIGQKISNMSEPEAQYIGLIKLKKRGIDAMKNLYQKTKDGALQGKKPFGLNKPFEKLYMTDFLQGIIDADCPVHSVPINRGWLEIDTVADYELARSLARESDSCLQIIG